MIEWSDEGIVLSSRKYGESAAIVALLTRAHGCHMGLVRGGAGRRQRGTLQCGNAVAASWRARLSEHLGTYTVELTAAHASSVLADAGRLAGLMSAAAVTETVLPEREPHPALFDAFTALVEALRIAPLWPLVYVRFELGLLSELGFGLDFRHCAVTGQERDLVYVSPRSGRAVSREAGAAYRDRLLPLPGFLVAPENEQISWRDVRDGLRLTGFFIDRHIYHGQGRKEPAARTRFVDRISRLTTRSGDIFDS